MDYNIGLKPTMQRLLMMAALAAGVLIAGLAVAIAFMYWGILPYSLAN
jgi:hypothetical protein